MILDRLQHCIRVEFLSDGKRASVVAPEKDEVEPKGKGERRVASYYVRVCYFKKILAGDRNRGDPVAYGRDDPFCLARRPGAINDVYSVVPIAFHCVERFGLSVDEVIVRCEFAVMFSAHDDVLRHTELIFRFDHLG